MTEMINQLLYEDPLMTARRFTDTRRYVVYRWNTTHTEPIDENQVGLFLADEHYGSLTEEQKGFIRDCRNEMGGVYNDTVFRVLEYLEMQRRGMVGDLMNFCRIFLPDSPTKCA